MSRFPACLNRNKEGGGFLSAPAFWVAASILGASPSRAASRPGVASSLSASLSARTGHAGDWPEPRFAMRANGWKMPFHGLQLVTWVVFPVIMALFFAFYTPVLERTTAYVASAVYAAACLITTVSVVICTGTDPADDCVLRPSVGSSLVEWVWVNDRSNEPYGQTDVRDTRQEDQVYCNVCMKFVYVPAWCTSE